VRRLSSLRLNLKAACGSLDSRKWIDVTTSQEFEAAERVARDVEDLDDLEASVRRDRRARATVGRLRRRRLAEAPSLRLSVAARMLEVSVPTVRAWVARGVLESVPGTSPRRVTLASVLDTRRVVRELRALGRDRDLLAELLARAEDERVLSDRRLRRSLDEMRRGELIDITPAPGEPGAA